MIVWDLIDGGVHVWMHDSDPASDSADQIVSGPFTYDSDGWPPEVKSEACWNEVAEAWPNLTDREVRILGEAALEKIERR